MNKIIEKEYLTDTTVKLVFDAPEITKESKAGHFVFVHLNDEERSVLSIADTNTDAGTITLVVEAVGDTSTKLAGLSEGDELKIEGPKGKEIAIEQFGTVLAIAGAAGIASMLMTVKELKTAGNKVMSILVAQTEEQMFFEADIMEYSDELTIFTYDNGDKNGLSALIEEVLSKENISKAFLMGPRTLLSAANDVIKGRNIAVQSTLW